MMASAAAKLFEDLLGPVETQGKSRPAPPNLRALGGAGTRDMAIAGDAYEGASTLNRELAMWQPASRSADNDILPQKRMSDARVRDTLRNDAYVRSGSVIHQDNIVGGAFTLNAKPMTKLVMGKDDSTWEGEFQEEVEAKFTLWAESTDNWPDASRRMSLTQMVRQAVGQYVATGEVLAVAEWAREDAFLRPFNTAVRMIDLDRLSTPLDKMTDRTVIGGVQVDGRHIPQGYFIRKAHPTDYMSPDNYQWEYVPRTKPWGRVQAIHMYEQMRPYQTRGISDIVAGLKEIRQTKTFRETVLQNAVVNATYAASIESDLDTNAIFQRLGGGNLGEDDFDQVIGNYIGGYLGAVQKYIGASNQFQIGGVRIPHLPPGSKLQMRPAGKGGPLGTEFEQSLLRYIASILGISYEQLSKDVSQTNYSSYRAAMGETWKFMQSRKSLVADRFATIIYRLWLEEALNKGIIESMPRAFRNPSNMDWFYKPQMLDAISQCDWIGASRGQVDELKETQAAVLRGKYNLSTDEDELGRLGKDWRRVYRQRAREKEMRKDLDIETAEESAADNMMNAASGTAKDKTSGDTKTTKKKAADSNADGTGTLENLYLDAIEEREDA